MKKTTVISDGYCKKIILVTFKRRNVFNRSLFKSFNELERKTRNFVFAMARFTAMQFAGHDRRRMLMIIFISAASIIRTHKTN